MKQFRTTFEIADFEEALTYHNSIFSIGSCFAEHISERLKYYLFDVFSNPNGILFNPISLAENLQNLMDRKAYQKSDLIDHDGLWNSLDHHHSKSGIDPHQMVTELNKEANIAAQKLESADWLLVTLGSAFAYEYLETGKIVANCHKIPNTKFGKVRIPQHRIIGIWQDALDKLFSKNNKIQVIFTVSPVRHIKDGIVANQRSKATLLLSVEALCAQYEHVHYFPSYEIMMDDLRDYRFYEKDLIHPNEVAIDYIWELFADSFIKKEFMSAMQEVDRLQKASQHRPMHQDSKESKSFKSETERKWSALKSKYPFLKS